MQEYLGRRSQGRRVLDYCCGNGFEALRLAKSGAREVVGIDISEKSIENCRRQARAAGLATIASFEVMDAEATSFPDSAFDVVTEYGALHHLDLRRAFAELARIVTADGVVVCAEVLGHNPLIHLYRRLTPHLRTEWEVAHVMRRRDLRLAKEYFGGMEMRFFHLATLAAVPFRKTRGFSVLLRTLESLDSAFLKLPVIKWNAWMVVFVLSRPRKGSTANWRA
jgi:ubiquinone/menaquinone biosynthesis C-methylase UbiE